MAGLYDYVLQSGSGTGQNAEDWYLTSYLTPTSTTPTIRPDAGAYLSNLVAANTMFDLRLHDRLGEPQFTEAFADKDLEPTVWARATYDHTKFKDATGQITSKVDKNTLQIGADLAKWSDNKDNRFVFGVMAGYGWASSDSTSALTNYTADGKVEGYALGLYGTWYANKADKTGFHLDSWI